jgi:hypothetical protein
MYSMAQTHLLSTYFSLLTIVSSHTNVSQAPIVMLIVVFLFNYSYNKQVNSTKKTSCKYV